MGNITSIPKEKWGVHETHCCKKHGCKYGDIDCPVKLGLTVQKYECEQGDYMDPCFTQEFIDIWGDIRKMGYTSDQCSELTEYIEKLLVK
jgi:hypothetical protein